VRAGITAPFAGFHHFTTPLSSRNQFHVLGRIVAFEVDHSCDQADAVWRLRIASVEIMLRQLADHPVPAK
jgi:hypothetical protein